MSPWVAFFLILSCTLFSKSLFNTSNSSFVYFPKSLAFGSSPCTFPVPSNSGNFCFPFFATFLDRVSVPSFTVFSATCSMDSLTTFSAVVLAARFAIACPMSSGPLIIVTTRFLLSQAPLALSRYRLLQLQPQQQLPRHQQYLQRCPHL